jgi:uncharacterized protein (DUF1810 family)
VSDEWDLERFVTAQESGGIYTAAREELRRGRKTGHWMWFIFPQVAGLGHSAMSRRYAISGVAEAQAYLDHPVLGPRLIECAEAVAAHRDRRAPDIMGAIDAQKLRSSMTLFHRAAPDEPAFTAVLDAFFGGEADAGTDERLAR